MINSLSNSSLLRMCAMAVLTFVFAISVLVAVPTQKAEAQISVPDTSELSESELELIIIQLRLLILQLMADLGAGNGGSSGGGGGGGSVSSVTVDGVAFNLRPEIDNEIEPGAEDAPVAEIEMQAEDESFVIEEMIITFESETPQISSGSIESVSLWRDGDKILEKVVNGDTQINDGDGQQIIRLVSESDVVTGTLDAFTVDTEATFVVAIDVANEAAEDDWSVYVDDDNIRVIKSDNSEVEIGNDRDVSDFEIQAPGDSVLIVRASANNPDSTTFEIDVDDDSYDFTILVFELDASDSDEDLFLEELALDFDINVAKDGTTAERILSDIALEVEGEIFDDVSFARSGDLVIFDLDEDLVVEAGDTVDVAVVASFEGAESGITNGVVFDVSVESIEGEADDGSAFDVDGSAAGAEHTLLTNGLALELIDSEAERFGGDLIRFEIDLETVALGEDILVFDDARVIDDGGDLTAGTAGLFFQIVDSRGEVVEDFRSLSIGFDSTADNDNGFFVIEEGNTEDLSLDVTFEPSNDGFYRLKLLGLSYEIDGDVVTQAINSNTFKTPFARVGEGPDAGGEGGGSGSAGGSSGGGGSSGDGEGSGGDGPGAGSGSGGGSSAPSNTADDQQRKDDLEEIADAMFELFEDTNSFAVKEGGYGGHGNGWFNFEGGAYTQSVASVLSDAGYLDNGVIDPSDVVSYNHAAAKSGYMIITNAVSDGFRKGNSFTIWANLDNPTAADLATLDECRHDNYDNYSSNFPAEARMNYCISGVKTPPQPIDDRDRKEHLEDIADALDELYEDTNSFAVKEGGYGGHGNGWFNFEGGAYTQSVASVLSDAGYLDNGVIDPSDVVSYNHAAAKSGYMIITNAVSDGFRKGNSFTIWANLDNPTAADLATLDECRHDNYDNYSSNFPAEARMNYCISGTAN